MNTIRHVDFRRRPKPACIDQAELERTAKSIDDALDFGISRLEWFVVIALMLIVAILAVSVIAPIARP